MHWKLPLVLTIAVQIAKPAAQIEVASIKPSRPDAVVQDARINFTPGRFEAMNITLREIVDSLKGIPTGNVEGGPKWVQSDRYDIVAKTEGTLAPSERGKAVLALLQERFKLAIHQEPRNQEGFALTVGKKAPDLVTSKVDEATKVTSDAHRAVFQATYMVSFANYLRQMFHVPVVDRTSLTGKFDFSLDMDAAVAELTTPTPRFSDRVRTAVEQLGFRLQPEKFSVDITVIDHAERPTEN